MGRRRPGSCKPLLLCTAALLQKLELGSLYAARLTRSHLAHPSPPSSSSPSRRFFFFHSLQLCKCSLTRNASVCDRFAFGRTLSPSPVVNTLATRSPPPSRRRLAHIYTSTHLIIAHNGARRRKLSSSRAIAHRCVRYGPLPRLAVSRPLSGASRLHATSPASPLPASGGLPG